MKTKLVPISENTVAKIYYSLDTGLAIVRTLNPNTFSPMITVIKKDGKGGTTLIIEKGLDLRDENSKVLEDLQKYIDSNEPITGVVEISSVEFLSVEYFKTSFKLDRVETKNFLKELSTLTNTTTYIKAIDLYNDLIAL